MQGTILLVGGTGLLDFRLRVAQSHVRHDMLPSHWSHAALLLDDQQAQGDEVKLLEVALSPPAGFGDVPANNGVQRGKLSMYDDEAQYPNIACLNFGSKPVTQIEAVLERFQMERHILDIPSLIVEWLRFVWGVGDAGNPLLQEKGIPSAAFLEGVFGLAEIELTPGLSSISSCPEAIWQSAKWWRSFYEAEMGDSTSCPRGIYHIRHRLVSEGMG